MTNPNNRVSASTAYIISDDPSAGLRSFLKRFGPDPDCEWEDTAAVFSPGVLSLHPDISPHPTASGYGVGYGTLIAVDAAGNQVAVWNGAGWDPT